MDELKVIDYLKLPVETLIGNPDFQIEVFHSIFDFMQLPANDFFNKSWVQEIIEDSRKI